LANRLELLIGQDALVGKHGDLRIGT